MDCPLQAAVRCGAAKSPAGFTGLKCIRLMESGRYTVSIALLDPLTRQVSYKTINTSVHPGK